MLKLSTEFDSLADKAVNPDSLRQVAPFALVVGDSAPHRVRARLCDYDSAYDKVFRHDNSEILSESGAVLEGLCEGVSIWPTSIDR